jgi:hypothetical protein
MKMGCTCCIRRMIKANSQEAKAKGITEEDMLEDLKQVRKELWNKPKK